MVKITDRDNGYAQLMKQAREFAGGSSVSIGVNSSPRAGSDMTNDELGKIHEFGLGTVPKRSFLRSWVDEQRDAIQEKFRALVLAAMFGSMTKSEALERMGKWGVEGVKHRIRENIPPPLDPETVRRKKGRDTALVDTEQLINAIEWEAHF